MPDRSFLPPTLAECFALVRRYPAAFRLAHVGDWPRPAPVSAQRDSRPVRAALLCKN